jgi:hypothetical protein
MGSLIVGLLWILLYVVLLIGVFLAVLWVLRYVGLPIPPQVDKFGVVVIGLLALIWVVSLFLVGGDMVLPPHHVIR